MTVKLPQPVQALSDLAYDLWWTWDREAQHLFRETHPRGWEEFNGNPVAMLLHLPPDRANQLSSDKAYLSRLAIVVERWRRATATPGSAPAWASAKRPVAYFCMEFGLHESLPIYSGGLGILAGDHLKSASDMGLPLVAVGLYYSQGYFDQVIEDGRQVAEYRRVPPSFLPMRPLLTPSGERLLVDVPEGSGSYEAMAWEVKVGRVKLYLLDTHVPGASARHRRYTSRLYGGQRKLRMAQEVLLGVGGTRLLRKLGLDPVTFHMNEGHAAFLTLELLREELAGGLDPGQAMKKVRQRSVFTTHTPVEAGHDRFDWDQVQGGLEGFRAAIGLPEGFFMDLGRVWPGDIHSPTCMTIIALRMSRVSNGVSRIHGQVSRDMWKNLHGHEDRRLLSGGTPAPPPSPIVHVTNGVHVPTWMSPVMARLLDRHAPGWRDAWARPGEWRGRLHDLPASELWRARNESRRLLCSAMAHMGVGSLDPHALTMGFARRFAPYKRADLLFADADRLAAFLGDAPAQLLVAGKAHPADGRGQDILARILRWTEDPRFKGRVFFIPGYDMNLGRLLVQGCDLWLNTPRKPHEASGTSGQKAAIQGGLNVSILDGWWDEAWDGSHGWAIRGEDTAPDADLADATALYQVLEEHVLPAWRDRDEDGLPRVWIRRLRRSIAACLPVYDSRRMLSQYLELYRPPE